MEETAGPHLIEFRHIIDPRGALTPIEAERDVPFPIRRVYFIYDVCHGAVRAGHSHKALQQILIAVSGSFTVHLDDGRTRQSFLLSRPNIGLYVPRMFWRDIDNFSGGAVCLALASDHYEESDYYRDYEAFLRAKGLR
ncbi:MAG: WxcM-like domain-containing protein [Methylobacterium sp.]|uniref:sugar 3,4-ketoisomerase n=1 Tax=Methylobacterium sp. TaxID=409 RepID=UPI000FA0F782|nr:FdtA/QdtA family cupin domain-containing protein [Methylobacterium sp.]RUP14657.1 MAG: WxcM-like domain-containing protein [Methylobacterium sp.]